MTVYLMLRLESLVNCPEIETERDVKVLRSWFRYAPEVDEND